MHLHSMRWENIQKYIVTDYSDKWYAKHNNIHMLTKVHKDIRVKYVIDKYAQRMNIIL